MAFDLQRQGQPMPGRAEQDRADFERVTELNEASKTLIARSFQVNLLALDAMVQSKRGGNSLRGFDEVSSQMRSWSKDLHAQLERLRQLSCEVVGLVSSACKAARTLRLLELAAASTGNTRLEAQLEVARREHEALRHGLARSWRQVGDMLGDLNLLGMMATVLSRSAMIEAASGNDDQRRQLSDVSQQFSRNSETVVTVLRSLTQRIGSDISP